MTTTIKITPHAAEPNEGVTLVVTGGSRAEQTFVPNGSEYETSISGSESYLCFEDKAPSQDEDVTELTTQGLTAVTFNPSGKPEVTGVKRLIEHIGSYIEREFPSGRRRSVAMTHLETASMFAVKSAFDNPN